MKTLLTVLTAAAVSVVALGPSAYTTRAAPFVDPPELNHPDWVTPFPYQRNILVGFDTDPHAWPDHITSPLPGERKALTPAVVHHEGTDDDRLYPSDWLAGDVQPPNAGYTEWLDVDPFTGTDREGILMLNAELTPMFFTLDWHIDNWDRPFQEKHFYAEAEFYSTGNRGTDELFYGSQIVPLTSNYEDLPDGWVRWTGWATLSPNPPWERMMSSISFDEPGMMLLDYMHIATECVPEPASLTLLAPAGLAALSRRRPRR